MTKKDDVAAAIGELKIERNAIILAHNYQLPKVQDIADFTGDSLELAHRARDCDAEVVVFCGVHFMAQTAAILSPRKTILLPDEHAGCPMADMVTADDLARLKEEHPEAAVVCYVNSTAEVKALCDVCCTSSNAVEVVSRFAPDREVIFVPDRHLGAYVQRMTGRELILWPGYCPTHARIMIADLEAAKAEYPGAPVIVHPECREEICLAADEVLSTGGMVRFCAGTDSPRVIVGTEVGLLHRLRGENPDKVFVPLLERASCPNMKLVTAEKILWSLEDTGPVVGVDEEIASRARGAVERMLVPGREGGTPKG